MLWNNGTVIHFTYYTVGNDLNTFLVFIKVQVLQGGHVQIYHEECIRKHRYIIRSLELRKIDQVHAHATFTLTKYSVACHQIKHDVETLLKISDEMINCHAVPRKYRAFHNVLRDYKHL
jgi:hypothetical protein